MNSVQITEHPALLRRFRDFGTAIYVTLLTYLLNYVLRVRVVHFLKLSYL